jgi:hypothetical protein
MAIRGNGVWVFPASLTKFASLAAVPIALLDDPRGLRRSAAIAGGVVVVSFILAPHLWFEYARFVTQIPTLDVGWYNIGATVPLGPRLGVAAALALAALRWRRVAAVSVTLALPVLWFHSLSVLTAVVASPRASNTPGTPS